MMNRQEFTKFAKRILHSKRGVRRSQYIHPVREWFTGLIVAIGIVGVSAVWSADTYLKYRNASVGEVNEIEGGVVVYRESLVKAALENFSLRKESLDTLLKSGGVEVPENNPVYNDSPIEDETTNPSLEVDEVIETEQPTTPDTSSSPEEEVPVEEESPDSKPTLSN